MNDRSQVKGALNLSLPVKTFKMSSRPARISLIICLLSALAVILYAAVSPAQQAKWVDYPTLDNKVESFPGSLPVPVPFPVPNKIRTNISHIVFGIGGNSATWRYRSVYSSLWWDPEKTHGFVWLDEEPTGRGTINYLAHASVPRYKISSLEWTRFKFSSSRSAVRMARIISDSFKLGLQDVRWFVMGDDDTVFFVDNLVRVLARYDETELWYIGGNSESVEQDEMHSYDTAYGGGGFAISYPLAERLVSILDGCLERYSYFYGSDERIRACISELGVPLTLHRGFHQFDIRGNPYGYLAAHPPTPLVSLHHLEHLDPLFPNQNQMDSIKSLVRSYRVDPARILQQAFCDDHDRKWSLSISWGYTIQLYPSLVAPMLLQMPLQTFKTWTSWSNGPFTFNTRPVPPNPCEVPIVFMLDRAEEVGGVGIHTSYKNVGPLQGKCEDKVYKEAMLVQRIMVSSEKLETEFWTKAPRRQCCEFINGGRIGKNSLHIKIRKC